LGVIPGLKRLGINLGHSPPTITAIKNEWDFTSAPTDYLRGMDTRNFTFLSNEEWDRRAMCHV